MGILMCTYKLTSQQAFDVLRRHSQETNRKLRDIAGEVSRIGSLGSAAPQHTGGDQRGAAEADPASRELVCTTGL
ncbi:MAG: hypothetical protein JWM76_2976 [Pseudonocardiales bacterium]|nr:hypothetical protein [Pseudonocardiales bacterium]